MLARSPTCGAWRWKIARRAGGDPGQPGLFGAPELSPALQPARLVVMETAGWAGLDAETREGFDRILAVLGGAGVEVLRSTDDPLIEAFERGIVEAKAITTDICDWENRWSPPCPCCGGRMIIVEVFARGAAPRGPPSGAGIQT